MDQVLEFLSEKTVVFRENWSEVTGTDYINETNPSMFKTNLYNNFKQVFTHFENMADFYSNLCDVLPVYYHSVTRGELEEYGIVTSGCICGKRDLENFCIIFNPANPDIVYLIGTSCIRHFRNYDLVNKCSICHTKPVQRGKKVCNIHWKLSQEKEKLDQLGLNSVGLGLYKDHTVYDIYHNNRGYFKWINDKCTGSRKWKNILQYQKSLDKIELLESQLNS